MSHAAQLLSNLNTLKHATTHRLSNLKNTVRTHLLHLLP
jgi:hypothetical protein